MNMLQTVALNNEFTWDCKTKFNSHQEDIDICLLKIDAVLNHRS